jgi:hypothetical protein
VLLHGVRRDDEALSDLRAESPCKTINVVRRNEQGTSRYAISLLRCDDSKPGPGRVWTDK